MKQEILCIKLGGSVITDKKNPYSPNQDSIRRIAQELKKIKKPLLIAHGVGSFAHTSAQKYGGKNGYTNKWGIAKVTHDVQAINQIVMEIFLEEGLSAVFFSPRSFLIAKKGKLQKAFFDPIVEAISQQLIPVICGDVIWDTMQKTTIFSGETTLNILCRYLQKQQFVIAKIIQLTDVDGVLDKHRNVIPEIMKENWPEIKKVIFKNDIVDVTGGMAHKVENALTMAQSGIETWIVNGKKERILNVILNMQKFRGTVIR
ncbi:MAG TPA: isopentenyl phosphate kinase [Methylomirabilota bacterium]|nr:isopentenyl phosphate kinase [Methylomirabilota bacterium]